MTAGMLVYSFPKVRIFLKGCGTTVAGVAWHGNISCLGYSVLRQDEVNTSSSKNIETATIQSSQLYLLLCMGSARSTAPHPEKFQLIAVKV